MRYASQKKWEWRNIQDRTHLITFSDEDDPIFATHKHRQMRIEGAGKPHILYVTTVWLTWILSQTNKINSMDFFGVSSHSTQIFYRMLFNLDKN